MNKSQWVLGQLSVLESRLESLSLELDATVWTLRRSSLQVLF